MALNIGNLNFGVDANTAGLQKAIAQLAQFQKKTDQVAKSQAKGSTAAANAMSRQESAIKKSLQATLQLQKAQKKADAPARQIKYTELAFRRLTQEMTSGKLTVVQYNRAMDAFATRMNRGKRALTSFSAANKKGAVGFARFSVLARDLESSAILALGPLSGLGARIRSLSAIFGRSSIKMAAMVAGIAGVVIGIGALAKAAVTAGAAMQGIRLRFEAATGSVSKANKEFAFARALSRNLGLEVKGLAKSYSRFLAASQGTNIEGEKSRKIFIGIARASAALKLSAEDVEGVMRAIEQIMSKGTVQAEELRGQLGDRLPGAFRIAAKAMGKTTKELNKMLKSGLVLSEDFLPKFAEQLNKDIGAGAEKNLNTLSGQLNRASTNFTVLMTKVDDFTKFSKVATWAVSKFAESFDILAGNASYFDEILSEVNGTIGAFGRVIRGVTKMVPLELSEGFEKIEEKVIKSIAALSQLNGAMRISASTGKSVEKSFGFLERIGELKGTNLSDLIRLSERLKIVLGRDVEASLQGVAAAWAEVEAKTRSAQMEFERLKNAPQALKDINTQLQFMRDKVAALNEGPEQAAIFDKITTGQREFTESLKGTTLSMAQLKAKEAEHLALLIQIDTLTRKNNISLRDQQKRVTALVTALNAISNAGERLVEMRKGPQALEFFDKVTSRVNKMRESLLKIKGLDISTVNNMLAVYQEQLEGIARFSDAAARAGEQMAQAVTNSLEDIILKGGSVKEMLRSLGMELLKVFLRAAFLDQLQSGLGGIFGKIFRNPSTGNPMAMAATGGSWKVGGSGAADSKIAALRVSPGETVSVTRASQGDGGGGGGIHLTINAPGADAGTIARIREMVRSEMVPQIIQASTASTIAALSRPRFS